MELRKYTSKALIAGTSLIAIGLARKAFGYDYGAEVIANNADILLGAGLALTSRPVQRLMDYIGLYSSEDKSALQTPTRTQSSELELETVSN
jgi:hypothetical protein